MFLQAEWLVVIGTVLFLSDLVLGLFVPMWFGAGFVIVGAGQFALGIDLNVYVQFGLSIVIGSALMFVFRKKFLTPRTDNEGTPPQSLSKTNVPGTLIKAEGSDVYQVKANGTYWRVGNTDSLGAETLDSRIGKQVLVTGFHGNTAIIDLEVS